MIKPDRPSLDRGLPGQDAPSEVEPALDPRCDGAPPLILTLALAPTDQARFDRLRAAHFPPDRNHLAAHVTLFHHLPGPSHNEIVATLREACGSVAPFAVAVTGLRSLGRGVAFELESAVLTRLRASLARKWADHLTPQDRQGFRPHVTVQNKADKAVARALLADLSAGFAPWTVAATGLLLWRYRGGPWDPGGAFPFTPPAPADPPERPRRSPSSAPS